MNTQSDVAAVADVRKAAALLAHPLRPRIVALAREPASATELATRLRLPRQRVNYHVRQLARTGFLRRAGQLRKRNLIEQRYVATARAYVLAPEILGPLAMTGHQAEDTFSAAHWSRLPRHCSRTSRLRSRNPPRADNGSQPYRLPQIFDSRARSSAPRSPRRFSKPSRT